MSFRAALFVLLLLPAPLSAAEGEAITAVRPDGTLQNQDGEAMRLAHLRLPEGLGPAAAPLQREAVALLRQICLHRPLTVARLGTDRWRRPLVTIRTADGDVEAALLSSGLAVVEPRASLEGGLAPLYAAEDEARHLKRGLWTSALHVHVADGAVPTEGFGIVEGTVVSAARVGSRIYVNFGADYKTDFTVLAEGDTARALKAGPPPATALAGYRIRVRGLLEEWNGPLLRLTGVGDMEILSAPGEAP
jgi:hypothetical protein